MERWIKLFASIALGLNLASGLSFAESSAVEGKVQHAETMAKGLALFKDQVRGILVENCLKCHGGEKIESEFDMSNRELLLASGLVSNSSEESDLIDSITHRFEPFMPHERDKLDEDSIEAITRWIDLGAPFDKPLSDSSNLTKEEALVITDEDRNYWAYRTLSKPDVPKTKDKYWPRNEIDQFILEKLEAEKLTPNKEAKRRTQIRRVYLNGIGIPPTNEEVAEFVNDFQPNAYERMVDRMLESPHYGERWARHWMDIARFAESTGFEIDFDRPYAYHYRDFLIKAFNQNMPYDEFVRSQIAGDELNSEDPLALMATGFLGGGVMSSVITEREFESSRYDELDDMVSTMGTALLGTTFGCARCHDHKYDPIGSQDYYKLVSNFSRTVRTYVDYDPGARTSEFTNSSWTLKNKTLVSDLANYEATVLNESFQGWLHSGPFDLPDDRWIVLRPETFSSLEDISMQKLWDDSVLVSGQDNDQENEHLFFEFETSLLNIVGLRMETLTHPHLPNNGPGSDHEGGFTVVDLTVHIKDLGNQDSKWKEVKLESAEATAQENNLSLSASAAINKVTKGWSVDMGAFGKDQALVIRFSKPVGFESGSRIKIKVASGLNVHQNVGRPRFSVTQDPRGPLEISEGTPVIAYQALLKLIVGLSPKFLSDEELVSLRSWYARKDPHWLQLSDKLVKHQLDLPISSKVRIMACSDSLPPVWHRSAHKGYPSFYETTHHLDRGDVDQKGEVAEPGFPQVLVRNEDELLERAKIPSPRTGLADWLTDVETGAGSLLARVFVNRVWHYHFGQGIVATPSDFGKQGENPSHPELLEWLATDFFEHGWDIKRLQKQIMTSAVYRQSSQFVAYKSTSDIDNRLLWRYEPRRAEAEVIRDSLLHVSDLLERIQFGPGTRDSEMLRRSIYFFIKRAALIPEMTIFDWPEHLVGIGQRASTTIAPQALQFLNGPQTRRYAEGLAKRLSKDESLEIQIKQAYELVLNRFPRNEETAVGIEFIQTQQSTYRDQGYEEQHALIDYCQSLLSLNEFLYIR